MFKATGIDTLRKVIQHLSENIEEATMDGMEEGAWLIYDKLSAEATESRETSFSWEAIWERITGSERDIAKARKATDKAVLREYVRSLRIYRDPSTKSVILAPDIEWSPLKDLSARYRFAAEKCKWWRTLKRDQIRQVIRTPALARVVKESISEIGNVIFYTIRNRMRI